MSIAFPKLRVGDPCSHAALSVFPLFSEPDGQIDYRLSDEAMADQSLLVEEISEGGSVPTLLVENKGDSRVLFLEGEQLIGAKQNRILNTSVLVAAHKKTPIPVSCVEQGRWHYKTRYFGASGSCSPSKLRRRLKESVSRSVKAARGHASDQSAVWQEVACLQAVHAVDSATGSMSDVFENYEEEIAQYRNNIEYVEGASGVAIAVGDRVVSVDLFDKPSTCRKVWGRLLSGIVFDALEAGAMDQKASVADVEQFLRAASDLPWEQAAAVGEGEEFRAQSPRGDQASALTFEGEIVHGSVMAPV